MSQYLAGQPGPPVSDLPLLIQRSRGEVSSYLTRVRTRQRRMLTLAVVVGALATAFAATPAIGGKPLSEFWMHRSAWQCPRGSCCASLQRSAP
jgi:hypothetical protein